MLEKLIMIGAKIVCHGFNLIFRSAAVAIPTDLFTYILRREVKLPHGEGVRMFNLLKMPWHRHPPPYRMENGRLVATEPEHDRAQNPGLPSEHVDSVIATSCIVQACMRRFHLDAVALRVAH